MLWRPSVEIFILFVADILEEVAVLLGCLVVLNRTYLQHRIFNEVIVDYQLVDEVVQVETKTKDEGDNASSRGDVEIEQLKDQPKSQIEDCDLMETVEKRIELRDSALLYFVLEELGNKYEDPAKCDDEHLHVAIIDKEGREASSVEPPVHLVHLEGLPFLHEP